MTKVHPTAIVEDRALIADDVEIGPYCLVGGGVQLATGVRLTSHVVVEGCTQIGERTVIHAFAVIGEAPQHTGHMGEATRLVIGADNIVREQVTMHCGTAMGRGVTTVGSNGFFMVGVHVGHDCIVGDHVVMANNATLGGHVIVEDHVIMGGLSAAHQNTRIGRHAFVGGMAGVNHDVIPFGNVWGNHAHLEGLNLVGLKRRGFSREAINSLRAAYRMLFAEEGTFQERLDDTAAAYATSAEVMEIVEFIRADFKPPFDDSAEGNLSIGAAAKLGLIAGGGALPGQLIRHCLAVERPIFVIRLIGFADLDLAEFDGIDLGLAQLGQAIAALRAADCRVVCLAGIVDRPDFTTLKPDFRGVVALPGAIRAAMAGDDALLRYLLHEFEKEGFIIEGAHEVMAEITLPSGPLGRFSPTGDDFRDIDRALLAARAVGELGIGQAVVCCNGLILAVEAQEGTDAMLARVAALPAALRQAEQRPRGVLAKTPKPGQDLRVDLPTIGPRTIEATRRAGLAGVVGEIGRLLVLDRETTVALADEARLFVFGVPRPL